MIYSLLFLMLYAPVFAALAWVNLENRRLVSERYRVTRWLAALGALVASVAAVFFLIWPPLVVWGVL